jgi:hypothetical protein
MCARTREHPARTCQPEAPFWFGDRSVAERRSLRPPGYLHRSRSWKPDRSLLLVRRNHVLDHGTPGLGQPGRSESRPCDYLPPTPLLRLHLLQDMALCTQVGTNVYRVFNGKGVPTKAVWGGQPVASAPLDPAVPQRGSALATRSGGYTSSRKDAASLRFTQLRPLAITQNRPLVVT